jgi:hypothetical protein
MPLQPRGATIVFPAFGRSLFADEDGRKVFFRDAFVIILG